MAISAESDLSGADIVRSPKAEAALLGCIPVVNPFFTTMLDGSYKTSVRCKDNRALFVIFVQVTPGCN